MLLLNLNHFIYFGPVQCSLGFRGLDILNIQFGIIKVTREQNCIWYEKTNRTLSIVPRQLDVLSLINGLIRCRKPTNSYTTAH